MTNLSDPRALRTKEALHKAAIRLLAKRHYSDISIRDIVSEAGIGYTTYFRHHPDTDELFTALIEKQINQIISVTVPVLEQDGLRAATEAMFAYIDKERRTWRALLKGGLGSRIKAAFLVFARQAGEPMAGNSPKIPLDCGVRLIVSSALELVDWWILGKQKMSITEMAEILDIATITPIMQANSFKIE